MAATERDEILLEVPATGPYARITRVAASAVALRLGIPVRVIEDLRLAVDEALVLLLASATPEESIVARYLVSRDELQVELAVSGDSGGSLHPARRDRFRRITAGLPVTSLEDSQRRVVLRLSRSPAGWS